MKPRSHKGVGTIGRSDRSHAAFTPSHAADEALRRAHDLARSSADGMLALASLAANRALAQQIETAFGVGRALREQSRRLHDAASSLAPAGPWRDAMTDVADAQARCADAMIVQATEWGRRFGGLAFSLPLPDRRH